MPFRAMLIFFNTYISTLYVRRGVTLMHRSSFKFALILKLVLPFWIVLVFELLLNISEIILCSMSALQVKTVLRLDAQKLLMLFVGTVIYLKRKLCLSKICYNSHDNFAYSNFNFIPCERTISISRLLTILSM
jgi:hypothetical protein